MNDILTRARGRPRWGAAAVIGMITVAGMAAAPLAFAQTSGIGATNSQPVMQSPGFFQSVFSMPGSGTDGSGASLSQQITCAVFGILDSFGILHAQSGCTPTSTFPFPIPGGTDGRGTLSVVKVVQGGTSTPEMFTLRVSGGHASPSSFAGNAAGTNVKIDARSAYSVSEDASSTSYIPTYSAGCSGTMPWAGFRTCVVTNTFTAPTTTPTTTPSTGSIEIVKTLSGMASTSTTTAADFLLHLHRVMNATSSNPTMTDVAGSPQPGSATGTIYADLPFGTYHVEEATTTSFTPSFSGACDSTGMITLSSTGTRVCTVTNTFKAPTTTPTTTPQTASIRVIKKVVNTGASTTSATSSPADFMLSLKNASSTDVTGSPHAGSATGTLYADLPFGTYRVSETGSTTSSYTPTYSGDCSVNGTISLTATGTKTCTLTNTWAPTTTPTTTPQTGALEIFKIVNGGNASSTATSSDFSIHVLNASSTDVSGSPKAGSASGATFWNLPFGTYHVTETTGSTTPSYTHAFSGECSSGGFVTIASSSTKSCTLTNTLATSTATTSRGALKIIKLVDNGTSSSTATSSDFSIHLKNASSTDVAGSPHAGSATGTTYADLPFGIYTISETGFASSTFTPEWSGACDSMGIVTIAGTSTATCTLTNRFATST